MNEERYERGLAVRKSLGIYGEDGLAGTFTEMNELAPTHTRAIVEYVFGTCWSQPLLDNRTREMMIVAAAAAQDLVRRGGDPLARRAEPGPRARGTHRGHRLALPLHRLPEDEPRPRRGEARDREA